MVDIILSIKPEYAEKILIGFKRFDPPIDPKKKNGEFKAPQSFAYIQDVGELGLEAP